MSLIQKILKGPAVSSKYSVPCMYARLRVIRINDPNFDLGFSDNLASTKYGALYSKICKKKTGKKKKQKKASSHQLYQL